MATNAKNKRNGMNLKGWRGPHGLRARTLERDQHLCQAQLPGCTHKATTVHIRPALDGDHRQATLHDCISLCHRCHGRIDGPRSPGGRGFPGRRRAAIPSQVAEIPPRSRRSREW